MPSPLLERPGGLLPGELQLVVGSMNRGTTYYTDVSGAGLTVLAFHPRELTFRELVRTDGVDNPTFLSVSGDGALIYSNAEVDSWNEGEVVVHRFDRGSGSLTYLGKRATRGGVTSYNSLAGEGARLLVTNYTAFDTQPDLSVVVFDVGEDGMISEPLHAVRHDGSGPDARRQTRSHAHSVVAVPGTDLVLVADLGLDSVLSYRIAQDGFLTRIDTVSPVRGAGPRHLAVRADGSMAFVITEMGSTVSSLSVDPGGRLEVLHTVSTLSDSWDGARNTGADLVLDPGGKHLYGSNRGDDSIVTITVDESGRLEAVGRTSSLGRTPRNLALTPDGGLLLCANQESHDIVVFSLDADGLPHDTGARYEIGTPMCMKMVG